MFLERARIVIYGDVHLSSKNYGAHRNYPKESLYYFDKIAEEAEKVSATHVIGLGDFTYGRFHTLEYRAEVERVLDMIHRLTGGNHYMLKGNHDWATYGMTEYDFYVKKGLLKPSENLKFNGLNIFMVDYGNHKKADIQIEDGKTNIILAHDYFKFRDTRLPNYGEATELDHYEKWFGVDMLVCGHIHNYESFSGKMVKDGLSHEVTVIYLGCMARPAYREGFMQDTGRLLLLEVNEGKVGAGLIDIPLWPLEESFNIEVIQGDKSEGNVKHVDISDIVKRLNEHERNIGNPEDLIMSLKEVDIRYRKKAVELLKAALK